MRGSHDPTASPVRQVFLQPGALHCTAEPSLVTTVLGSCVSLCLFDRTRRLGGINHFVLPCCAGNARSLRYGDVAIEALVMAMSRLGCIVDDLEAKVFGGAAMLPIGASEMNIGAMNVDITLERLQLLGIRPAARRTGGTTGLTMRYFTATGEVLVRPVAGSITDRAAARRDRERDENS